MANTEFLVVELELISEAKLKGDVRRALKTAKESIWQRLPATVKQKIGRAKYESLFNEYMMTPIMRTVAVKISQSRATMQTINALLGATKGHLIVATPVSQKRKRYFKGTHRDHGATKSGWKKQTKKTASKWICTFSNSKPDRVRFVEHGFKRPAKHAKDLAHPMMWQMDTDKQTQMAVMIPAMPKYPGRFFIAKNKHMLEAIIGKTLQFRPNLVTTGRIEYGDAYTYK